MYFSSSYMLHLGIWPGDLTSRTIALLHRRRGSITGGTACRCHLLIACRAGCRLRGCATCVVSANRSGIRHPGSACAMVRGQGERSGKPRCRGLSRIATGIGVLHVGVSVDCTLWSCCTRCRGARLLARMLACLLLLVLERRCQGGGQELIIHIVWCLGCGSWSSGNVACTQYRKDDCTDVRPRCTGAQCRPAEVTLVSHALATFIKQQLTGQHQDVPVADGRLLMLWQAHKNLKA